MRKHWIIILLALSLTLGIGCEEVGTDTIGDISTQEENEVEDLHDKTQDIPEENPPKEENTQESPDEPPPSDAEVDEPDMQDTPGAPPIFDAPDEDKPDFIIAMEKLSQIATTKELQGLKRSLDFSTVEETIVSALSVDLNGDLSNEDLTITITQADDLEGSNPTRIEFSVDESNYVYESSWNDGILVEVVDFDKKDAYLDIYILSRGTDIDCAGYIIRYDGKEFSEYISFLVSFGSIYFDGDGHIYRVAYQPYYDQEYFGPYDVYVLDIAAMTDSVYVD